MNYKVIFESERINFVKVSTDLAQNYLDMLNDKDVQKCISHETKVYSYDGEIKWINNKLANNDIIYSMIEKDTNEYIGNIELMHINDGIGEFGIAITPSKQNKHYGEESIKAFMDYVCNKLNLDGLDLYVYDFNIRAIKCYEKVGFKIVGKGKTDDEIHMMIRK